MISPSKSICAFGIRLDGIMRTCGILHAGTGATPVMGQKKTILTYGTPPRLEAQLLPLVVDAKVLRGRHREHRELLVQEVPSQDLSKAHRAALSNRIYRNTIRSDPSALHSHPNQTWRWRPLT